MLALAMEREEEERRKYLAAQEEYDLELAKKLDLELNIDSNADVTAGETVLSNGGRQSSANMPGGW